MYICPKCRQSISTEVKKVIWHLREIHALSDGQDFTIICSQDGCPRTYHTINSFSKHLHRDHQSTATQMDNVSFQAIDQSSLELPEPSTSNIEETPTAVQFKTTTP